MSQNVDDYYSSISSPDTSSGTGNDTKKVVVKKKLKVKAKKPTWEDTASQDKSASKTPVSSQESDATTDTQSEATLNETLEKQAKPKLKVVSRNEEASQRNEGSHESRNDSRDVDARDDGVSVDADTPDITPESGEKKTKKFKSGFSKPQPPSQKASFDETQKPQKKWAKSFHDKKSQKYKKRFDGEDDGGFVRSTKIKQKKKTEKNIEDIEQNLKSRAGETVVVGDVLSVKEFSEKIGVPLPTLIAEFMKNGIMVTLNAPIDFDTASLIAENFDVTLQREDGPGVEVNQLVDGNVKELLTEEDSSKLSERPPVISIMGHVDHGKTSILDYIRSSQVASGEAGGITQSIGAYQVDKDGRKITFLDTPGHEAFTIMRARGAKSTDIAILVVAADEGVKPQTIESISHAREAGIPVIVAINKMDKEWANPDFVKGQLAENGLTPEDWGGETPMVPVSAISGFGMDELLDMILLVADMGELKANPDRPAIATIIESHLDTKLGPVATALVNTGTIHKGDAIVSGSAYGKVKLLKDYTGQSVKEAVPGEPVLIVGLDKVVEGGDILQVVSGIDVARDKAVEYEQYVDSQKKLNASQLDMLLSRIKSGNLKQLKIVLKADTNGSLEAIRNSLLKLSTPETNIMIIHGWVGNISEGDVVMSESSDALLVGFNVSVGPNARKALENAKLEFIESRIIYHITERVEKIVTGMLDPKEVEIPLCLAQVKQIFYTGKDFLIVGIGITAEGETVEKWAQVRVLRGDKMVGKGIVASVQQWVEEVQKLEGPIECGIRLEGTTDVQEKDQLEIYKIEIQK